MKKYVQCGKYSLFLSSAAAVVAGLTALAMMVAPGAVAQADSTDTPMSVQQVLDQDGQKLLDSGILDSQIPHQARVLTQNTFDKTDTNVGLVRLDNNKITFMTKDSQGKSHPFLAMSVETGFWDTRACGGVYAKRADKLFSCVTSKQSPFYKNGSYEAGMKEAFRQMKEDYGFNTVQITVNWAEWDRTVNVNNPQYDFSVMDDLATWAKEAGLKVFWVLFFQVQTNMPAYQTGFKIDAAEHPDEAYRTHKTVYNLADKDGFSYGIQWGNGRYRNVSDFPSDANNAIPELYPEFWHPVMFAHIKTALSEIAKHYRHSDTVIGYQVGNETGVCGAEDYNYYQDANTANPYYLAMFELWKKKTGKTSLVDFRHDLGLGVWHGMIEAMRAQDPYKVLTTNFQSSDVDKNPTSPGNSGGQNLDFYRDAGLDLIAPMYYGHTEPIRGNVDSFYGSSTQSGSLTAQELPGLFPSEIGIGWNRGAPTQSDILDTLSRGGLGFGLYSMGEMLTGANKMQLTVHSLLNIFNADESLLATGIPVDEDTTDNIHLSTGDASMTLSTVETTDANSALGIMWADYNKAVGSVTTRPVTISVMEPGKYRVETMINTNAKDPTVVNATVLTFTNDQLSQQYNGVSMDGISSAFIKVTKIS